jgi:hypothetical protein
MVDDQEIAFQYLHYASCAAFDQRIELRTNPDVAD